MKPLRKQIEKRLNIDRLRSSPIDFIFSAVDLQRGVLIEIDKHKSPLVDWLLASCSIPGVFEPVEIDGHQFVDGGVLATQPLSPLISAGVNEIDIIECRPIINRESPKRAETIIDTAQRSLELVQSEMVRIDVERCNQINETIKKWGYLKGEGNIIEGFVLKLAEKREDFPLRSFREVDITVIEPPGDLIDTLEFDHEKIQKAIALGYDEAKRIFDQKKSQLKVE